MDFIKRTAEQWFRGTIRSSIPAQPEVLRWVEKLRRKNPGATPEQLALIAIDKIKWKVWLIAVVAGVFSNPVFCVLLAWVETKKLIKWQVETSAKIAGIFAPDTLADSSLFESDILAILMPQAVDEELELAARTTIQPAVGAAGTHVVKHATRAVIRTVISKNVLKFVKRMAWRFFAVKVTQRAILTKAVPLAGILVGVLMNHHEITRTGKNAIEHSPATVALSLSMRKRGHEPCRETMSGKRAQQADACRPPPLPSAAPRCPRCGGTSIGWPLARRDAEHGGQAADTGAERYEIQLNPTDCAGKRRCPRQPGGVAPGQGIR